MDNKSLDKQRSRMEELVEFRSGQPKDKILTEQFLAKDDHMMDANKENPTLDSTELGQAGNDIPEDEEDHSLPFRIARIGENKVRIQDSQTGDHIDVPIEVIDLFSSKLNDFKTKI